MTKQVLYILLLSLLLADIGHSFVLNMHKPLDGDMAWNILPADDVKPIFNSPFGLDAIINNITYANPNRFYCHWIFKEYLGKTPLLLQKIVDPIDSVYLSCAISKTLVQVLLIILLAMAVSGTKNLLRLDFIFAAVLVTPLFQTNGFQGSMGIIDPSTTYTFFYALPCAFLLLYFLPFIFEFFHEKKILTKSYLKILWIPLAIIVCLSGPLNPGAILIFSILLLLANGINNSIGSTQDGILKRFFFSITNLPRSYYFYLVPVCLLSIYSLYLGRYNSLTITNQIPICELYAKLPKGIYCQFASELGFPILILTIIINALIIRMVKIKEGKRILNIFQWIAIFSLCYILLLPLGGYRSYRPNILRYDTIMPITLCLIFVFGVSTLLIFRNLSNKQNRWYISLIVGVLFVFTIVDSDGVLFENNKCERVALTEIAESKDSIVQLHDKCRVLAWDEINSPENSELNAKLLNIWRVTKVKKLYYNR